MAVAAAPIEVYDELDSTNAEARRRAEAGEVGPLWITARVQTAGRGRRGRAWSTRAGNLAATLLTTTDLPPAVAAQVSFVAALAAADLTDHFVGPGASALKWPNDVLLYGRKAVGILVESGGAPEGRLWLAIGVGVNLAEAPQDVERPAAAFGDFLEDPPEPMEALQHLAARFEHWRALWLAEGFAPVAEAWTRRAAGLGGPCEARLPQRTLSGVAEGLELDGALRLRLADGKVERVTAGDVFFGA